ncbi:DUF6142 family protein [Paenibacillus sp.]|uniref:DUF6142 family protein n=1 Tax=Paenibacillus sp. TaxID=58172 RepID=UPI002D6AB606|nr:DUF6142 family protein [Paenibacillus sp.]HZG83628.1 DUF6142 family protein [Paenibacillus sp.]
METTHSRAGIASFLLAAVSVVGLIAAFAFAASMAPLLAADPEAHLGRMLAAVGLMCLFVVTALVGGVLGIVGLFQKQRSRLFSILGLSINALLVAAVMALLLFGMISAPALPGTFDAP